MAAAGFVDIFFAQDDGFSIGGEPVGVGGEVAAMIADGVELGDIFGYSQKVGHGTKGSAAEVHIETGDDHPVASEGEFFADFPEGLVKKLGFIDADDIDIGSNVKDFSWKLNSSGRDRPGVMTDDFVLAIAGVPGRFVDFNRLFCNPDALESPDQFFGLAGKHRSADHFNPAPALCVERWFEKHAKHKDAFFCLLLRLPATIL